MKPKQTTHYTYNLLVVVNNHNGTMSEIRHWASASLSSLWLAGLIFYLLNCNTLSCVKDPPDCEHVSFLTNWMIVTQIYGHTAYVFVFLESSDIGKLACATVYVLVLCSEAWTDSSVVKIPNRFNNCDGNGYWWLLWWLLGAGCGMFAVDPTDKHVQEKALGVFLMALNMSVVVYVSFWAMIHVDGNVLTRYIGDNCSDSQVLVGNEIIHVLPIIINLATLAMIESVETKKICYKTSIFYGFGLSIAAVATYNLGQLILRCNDSECSMTRIYTKRMDEYVYFIADNKSCDGNSIGGALVLLVLQCLLVGLVHFFLLKIFKQNEDL